MVPGFGAIDAPLATGFTVGVVLGVLNLLASNWNARRALRLKSGADAIKVMILGFAVRLAVLALAIFTVPRSWMNAEAFVLTFMVAFFVGFAFEARILLGKTAGTAGAEDRPDGSADSRTVVDSRTVADSRTEAESQG